MNVSIIIPTWNRSQLLEKLLESLQSESHCFDGDIEVVVVDSSDGNEKLNIQTACAKYGALYLHGEQSVRKKRNLGVRESHNELLLFLDSDVIALQGLVAAHVDAYNNREDIGAAQGLTEFVGKNTFLWNSTKLSKLVWSFSNAKRFPYQSWSITNNLSVRRDVFDEIGGFCEDFPFKLGGDDLEMSYRINKAGYLIASAPDAVAEHSKETWNHVSALYDRARRWGTMESQICNLHPELYRYSIPPNYVFESLAVLMLLLLAICLNDVKPLFMVLIALMLFCAQKWIGEIRQHKRFIWLHHLAAGCTINALYEFFRIKGHVKQKHRFPMLHAFVFNAYQVRGSFYEDSPRLWLMLFDYLTILVVGVVMLHA